MKNYYNFAYSSFLCSVFVLSGCSSYGKEIDHLDAPTCPPPSEKRPNIIYFLCDDLGIGELGCYGQQKIKTPNIDRLAAKGMLFTQHYSGCTVCAPSRCSLLTGQHMGHSFIRGNREIKGQGQYPIPTSALTIAEVLKTQGYVTACVGKWGLGGVGTTGDPLKQGFDHFFGYNCQRHAHSYYPNFLWNDDQKITINEGKDIPGHNKLAPKADPNDPKSYQSFIGVDWTPDLMISDALKWMQKASQNGDPFFLYYATPLPHVGIQVPEYRVKKYQEQWGDEKPYTGGSGYSPTRYPRAGYAAMIDKIDEDLGLLMNALEKSGLENNTIIMFCSDNGPTFNGGTQSRYFKSARQSRGLKCDLYEGGIRVPFIVSWPNHIQPGSRTDFISTMYDIFPTLCSITQTPKPQALDGVDLLPTLKGEFDKQEKHDYLYWEYFEGNRCIQALREGNWKLIKFFPSQKVELYDLANDPSEKNDLANKQVEKCNLLESKISEIRVDSEIFKIPQKNN